MTENTNKYCFHCMSLVDPDEGIYCANCGKKHSVHYSRSDELPAGTKLNNGRYIVGRSIGSGGFGISYIGYDTKLERKILIKETFYSGAFHRNVNDLDNPEPLKVTYDRSFSLNDIMRKTKKECVSLSEAEGLNNIVKVYDWFSENNTAYIITEFINGVTLDLRIEQQGTYTWDELYSKLKPLILSLSKLHSKGIIHRDIKPQNIMIKYIEDVGEDFVLIDFGLARSTDTRTLPSIGLSFSPGYSPLEQRTFTIMDGEYTDIYSLAATIYFALTGKSPNSDIVDTVEGNFPEINNLVTKYNVPQNVQDALIYALNPNYKNRCSDLKELMQMFQTEKPKNSTSKQNPANANNRISNRIPDNRIKPENRANNMNNSPKRSLDNKNSRDNYKPKSAAENRVSHPQTKGVSNYDNSKKTGKPDTYARDTHYSSPAKTNSPVYDQNSNKQYEADKNIKTENVPNHKVRNAVIVLSVLVAVVLCIKHLTSTTDSDSFIPSNIDPNPTVSYDTSGTCGDGVKWIFNEGILRITGNGKINDYEYNTIPWYGIKDKINSVSIEDGITSIGKDAFYGCAKLSDVTIADSVTTIDNSAFSKCTGIKKITIPKNVVSINSYAFSECEELNEITISAKVIKIDGFAFSNCYNLKEITFEGDKPSLKSTSFNSDIAVVKYPKDNKTWDDIKNKWDGGGSMTFEAYSSKEKTAEADSSKVQSDKSDSSKEQPVKSDSSKEQTVEADNNNSSSNDAKVTLSISAQGECGEHAVWTLLEDTLRISGSGDMTDYEYLETIKLANTPWRYYLGNIKSIVIENGITSIGDNAFDSCINVTDVSLPNSITEISYGAFTGCTSLSTITIPETVVSINDYAFEACTGLSEITIPQSVTSIGASAFNGCYSLSTVTFKGNKPAMINDTANNLITFDQDTATVKYPINNPSWQNIAQTWDGGGNMTFEAY